MRKEKWIQICKIQGFEEIKDYYWISNTDEDKIMNRSTGKQMKIWLFYRFKILAIRKEWKV